MAANPPWWRNNMIIVALAVALIGAAATIIAALITSNSGSGASPSSSPVRPSSSPSITSRPTSESPTKGLSSPPPGSRSPGHRFEVAANDAMTHSDYTNGGGKTGTIVPGGRPVAISCRVIGLRLRNGNDWWYRLSGPPWNGEFYVSADPFYNGVATNTPLAKTPFVDKTLPVCE